MTTAEVKEYYRQTRNSQIRPELTFALSILEDRGTAIDCGCGAGSNIKHLLAEGFTVYAFDIDKEAISLCAERYKDNPNVVLSRATFGEFDYPNASLVVADASLFFCAESEFNLFLKKMRHSLIPHGVFCGAFLGARDTMAQADFNNETYWGNVLVQSENEIREALSGFDILQFTELETDGKTPGGEDHHWHIFSVVARVEN